MSNKEVTLRSEFNKIVKFNINEKKVFEDFQSIRLDEIKFKEKINELELKKDSLLKKILKYRTYEDRIENTIKDIKILVGELRLGYFKLKYKKVNVKNLTNECISICLYL